MMTPEQIAKDIERGRQIKLEIEKLTEELKQIEARLEAAGLEGVQVPLQDANREGKQFLARSPRFVLPVRFESDLIIGSFATDSDTHKEVQRILGPLLPQFFKSVNKFERVQKDGEGFRKLARQLLKPDQFAELIKACTSRDKKGIAKSKTVVAWDDVKDVSETKKESAA